MLAIDSCSDAYDFDAHHVGMHVGDRVRKAREALGITQNELGRRAKLKPGYVSLLESGQRGKRLSGDFASALARVLGVRYEWLLSGTGPQRLQDVSDAEVYEHKIVDKQSDSLRGILGHPTSRARWPLSTVALAYEHASTLPEDPGPAYWVHYLDEMSVRMKALVQTTNVPKLFEENPSESGLIEKAGPNSSTPPKRRIS